jgi:hypothetical protein
MFAILLSASASGALADPESTGVPVCDAFLKKHERCARERIPEPERSEALKGIALAREAYRRMSANRFKPDVAGACEEASKTVLPFLTRIYGCRHEGAP